MLDNTKLKIIRNSFAVDFFSAQILSQSKQWKKVKLFQFHFKLWKQSIECNFCVVCWCGCNVTEISNIAGFFISQLKHSIDKFRLKSLMLLWTLSLGSSLHLHAMAFPLVVSEISMLLFESFLFHLRTSFTSGLILLGHRKGFKCTIIPPSLMLRFCWNGHMASSLGLSRIASAYLDIE